MSAVPRANGPRIVLRPFTRDDISERYLKWLDDPEVNRYSRRSLATEPSTVEDAHAFLASLKETEFVFAIVEQTHGHVGNIKLGPIDDVNERSDISILIGERTVWGQAIGAESVYLATKLLFNHYNLNRVEAGSANPAFIAMVHKLGWQTEGCLRSYVRLADGLHDWTLLSLLRSEFRFIDRYEV